MTAIREHNISKQHARTRFQDLRYADLLTFLAVRRSESITAAARSLRVTPSQVSKAISRLESQIGASLFKRTTRGVLLADAGKRALPHLEEIAARLRAIQSEEGAQQPV